MLKLDLEQKDRNGKPKKMGSLEIKNQAEDAADLYFFGDIISESLGEWQKYYPDDKAPSDVQDFLNRLDGVKKINVHINSGGGSVFGGIAIYNILKRHDAEITVYVDGLAASIASVIAMAGDRIIIPRNAQMMIHKPSSIAWGDADDMRKEADVLDGCQKVILNTYMRHAKEGVTEEQINSLIDAETWKTGEDWQEYFDVQVSETDPVAAATSEYFDKYRNLPKNLARSMIGKPDAGALQPSVEQMGDVLADIVADRVMERMGQQGGQNGEQEKPLVEHERLAAEILEDLDLI